MRSTQRSGVVRNWIRFLMLAMLVVTVAGPQLAAAQDSFDLPSDLTDYAGLTAITANSVDGVNLRAEPGTDSDVLLSVPDGNVVDLRVDKVNTVTTDDGIRWWPVSIWDTDGWIAGIYLASSDSASASASDDTKTTASDDTSSTSTNTSTSTWKAGDYVSAATDFLAMRAGPGTKESRIAWLGLGDVVQIVDGPFINGSSDWWLVTDGSINAYVFGGYLATASELDIKAPASDAPVFAAGDAVEVALGSGGANVREDATASSDKIGSLTEGSVVTVVDGPSFDKDGAPWYLVKFTSKKRGFVVGEALEASTADANTLSDTSSADAGPVTGPTGTYHYPLTKFTQTQGYGCTIYSFEPYNAELGCPYHNGLDLAAPLGTPLLASDGGVIKYAGWCDCGLGLYVEIDHQNGTSTVYGHMSVIEVIAGQAVNQGEEIGQVGSTGNSTGPHCHFMLKFGDNTVDPTSYMSS